MIFLPSGNAPTLEIREFELYINLNIALYCLKIVKFLIDKIINFHLVWYLHLRSFLHKIQSFYLCIQYILRKLRFFCREFYIRPSQFTFLACNAQNYKV